MGDNYMYRSKQTINTYNNSNSIIKDSIVELISIDIKRPVHGRENAYAVVKVDKTYYDVRLEIFEKYFELLKY